MYTAQEVTGNTTTIRVSKKVRDMLKHYAEQRGLTLGNAVKELLKENELSDRLKDIEDLLKEQNKLLRNIVRLLSEGVMTRESLVMKPSIEEEGKLPSFIQENPWLEILRQRGER